MMGMTPESAKYFQQVARHWDALRRGYFGEQVREAAIKKAYLRPEMAVADIGAGTGFMAAGLAPLVRRVYVVDGSPAMLEVARENLQNFDNIEFHESDGMNLPFPEESLDAVFANMYLHHCFDPLAAIREMVRVLRPGGRLVITDMDRHPFAWLKEEMADTWQGFERSQLREWFQQSDLVNIIVDCTGQSCCAESSNPTLALDESQDREANISVFVATGVRRAAVQQAVAESYGALARQQGGCCCHAGEGNCNCESPSEDCNCASTQNGCSCGGGCCGGVTEGVDVAIEPQGYTSEELASAPEEAVEISLGCGNPLALADLKAGEVVLDIGSGGGLDSFLAAQKVGEMGRVIGIDMTPAMLERARAAANRRGITNVEFREGFAEELPVGDRTVDVVISNCVINLTEDKGKAFFEAARVLKPGGRLEISDVVLSGAIPLDWRDDMTGWAECVTGALPEQEYLDLISQAGFVDIKARRSASAGRLGDVSVYSAIISARKPAEGAFPALTSCGCNG